MRERRPITSVKRAGQRIGYIEGDQAFDLFARPCASYDHATGLLRDLNTQMIVGYVSLKHSFVGSSFVAEELFPAPLQNGGEPLDDTLLSNEPVPIVDGSSQGERELQGKHLQNEPENLAQPSLQDERASSARPALQDMPEPHQHSLHSGSEPLSKPNAEDERSLDESSLQGQPEPRAEDSLQREPKPLSTPLEGVASAALLRSGEVDPECSSWSVDPKDSTTLRGVDMFMVNLAEYLQAADTAGKSSNHDESKPCATRNTSAENESLSAAVREPSSLNGPESLQIELGSDDNFAGAPANLHGAASIVPSPARSTQDAGRPVSFLEPDAKTEEDNNQSDRYQHGPASAADEGRSDTDIQREQIASGMNPLDVKLDSAHDAVKNEIQDTEDTVQN